MSFQTFICLGFPCVLFVIALLISRRPRISILCYFCFSLSFALFVLHLNAQLIAIFYLLISAGLTCVFLIFSSLSPDQGNKTKRITVKALVTGCLSFAVVGALGWIIAYQFLKLPAVTLPMNGQGTGQIEYLGPVLFSQYLIPLEILGVLILLGLVGCVLLIRKDPTP